MRRAKHAAAGCLASSEATACRVQSRNDGDGHVVQADGNREEARRDPQHRPKFCRRKSREDREPLRARRSILRQTYNLDHKGKSNISNLLKKTFFKI